MVHRLHTNWFGLALGTCGPRFASIVIVTLLFGVSEGWLAAASPDHENIDPIRLDAVTQIRPEELAETMDSSLLFRLCMRGSAPRVEIGDLNVIADGILSVYSEESIKRQAEDLKRKLKGESPPSSPEVDSRKLGQAILMRTLAHVLKGVSHANCQRFEAARKSFESAREQREVAEDLTFITKEGERYETFELELRKFYPVASRSARLINLPVAILYASDPNFSRNSSEITSRFIDAFKPPEALESRDDQESGDDHRWFCDSEVECWRCRVFGEWLVKSSGEHFIPGENRKRLFDNSRELARALAQVHRRFFEVEAMLKANQGSIDEESLPKYFELTNFDFNRDSKIDEGEFEDFRRTFDNELPLASVREIRGELRKFKISHENKTLSDKDVVEASKKGRGTALIYYDFRGPDFGKSGDFAAERRLNMAIEEEFRGIDPLPTP